MILPTKRLSVENSLLGVSTDALRLLDEPKPISRLWDDFRRHRDPSDRSRAVSFEWFVLALDFLFIAGAVYFENGRLHRNR